MRHITIPRNPLYTEYINMFPNMLNNIIFYDFTQIKAVNTFYSDIIDKIKSDPKPNPL